MAGEYQSIWTGAEIDEGIQKANDALTQVQKKANDYSIELYNGTGGNPKPVRFARVNYSTCDSNNGVSAKISMVSGHGNGISYVFMQDAIINVAYNGTVTVDNFKYYGAETPTYDGAVRQYGDIFWVNDTTNKIVDFYCLMGQYSRVNMTPWKRLTYSSGGAVAQYTSASVYSSGTKVWANNSEIATLSDIPTDTNTTYALSKSGSTITLTGSDGSTTSVTDDSSTGGEGSYLPLSGGTMPGNIILNNSNPHLGLQDTTGNVAYFQTYDDGSGLKAGFGYGWANSLKLDTLGNLYLIGSLSDGTNSVSIANIAKKSDIPTDTNTTYTLSKSGSTITLTGSDGSTTSVTDDSSGGGGGGNYLPLSGGTLSGDLDFSDSSSWVKPYLLAFKNADPNTTATYPYTGFYQWGDEWQVNARDANNTWARNVMAINLVSGVANFVARPTVNGSNLALLSDIPQDDNTTYTLTKNGSTITLTGSDGSTTSVTDDNTTYDLSGYAVKSHSHGYIQDGTVGIKSSDSNEISFASNNNVLYFGYDNRLGSSALVDTYKFGTHSGVDNSTNGRIECGSVGVGGSLSATGGAYVSGRYYGSGDDEGLVIGRASNNYAGITLGGNTGYRSVMYLMPDNSAVWRYGTNTASYDIKHPAKAGTIALTSDIAALEARIAALETALASKQDKIETWNDLKGGD